MSQDSEYPKVVFVYNSNTEEYRVIIYKDKNKPSIIGEKKVGNDMMGNKKWDTVSWKDIKNTLFPTSGFDIEDINTLSEFCDAIRKELVKVDLKKEEITYRDKPIAKKLKRSKNEENEFENEFENEMKYLIKNNSNLDNYYKSL